MKIELVLKIDGEEVMKFAEVEHEVEAKVECDQYSRIFDETCPGWSKDAELNKLYLLHCQNYLNDKLMCQGYLYLNEAYETLGFAKTKEG